MYLHMKARGSQTIIAACALTAVVVMGLLRHLVLGAGPSARPQEAAPLLNVGFIITAYKEPIGQIRQMLRLLRHSYPDAPVMIRSDGGNDFQAACQEYGCNSVLGRRLAYEHRSWYKDNDFGFNCVEYLHAIDQAVSWMNTSWFVLLEPDTMVTRPMSVPPAGLKAAAMANYANGYSSNFAEWIESHQGRKLTSTWGNPGGLMEVAAWKAAISGLDAREEALRIHDICPKCVASDDCVARLFALDGQDLQHWIEFLEVGRKFPTPGVLGWDSMAEFKVWPAGTDISPCLDCFQRCSKLCPQALSEAAVSWKTNRAVDCVVSERCGLVCPALLHEMDDICGATLTSVADVYRKHGNWRGEQLLCLTTGFCRPNHTLYVRFLWIPTLFLVASSAALACSRYWRGCHSANARKIE